MMNVRAWRRRSPLLGSVIEQLLLLGDASQDLSDRKVPHVRIVQIRQTATPDSSTTSAASAACARTLSRAGLIAGEPDRPHVLKHAAGELHGRSIEFLIPHRYRLAHIGHRLRFTDDRRTRPMGAGLELVALCKDGSERRVDLGLKTLPRGLETLVVATMKLREARPQAANPLSA